MADGSRYLKCEKCDIVLDRRVKDDWKDGGTFRYGSEPELRTLALLLGWTRPTETTDLCPTCSAMNGPWNKCWWPQHYLWMQTLDLSLWHYMLK